MTSEPHSTQNSMEQKHCSVVFSSNTASVLLRVRRGGGLTEVEEPLGRTLWACGGRGHTTEKLFGEVIACRQTYNPGT